MNNIKIIYWAGNHIQQDLNITLFFAFFYLFFYS